VLLAFAVLILSPVVKAAFVAHQIVNPVSLFELSTHFKVTLSPLLIAITAVAVKPEGDNGTLGMVTLAVFELADAPAELNAFIYKHRCFRLPL